MKLRMTTNSIRIRVRKSELSALSRDKQIVDAVRFPSNAKLKFALSINSGHEKISASLNDNYLEIAISETEANNWINTNQVGIESHLSLDSEEELHLLIEKDFPCKDRLEEDKSDTFTELVNDQSPAC